MSWSDLLRQCQVNCKPLCSDATYSLLKPQTGKAEASRRSPKPRPAAAAAVCVQIGALCLALRHAAAAFASLAAAALLLAVAVWKSRLPPAPLEPEGGVEAGGEQGGDAGEPDASDDARAKGSPSAGRWQNSAGLCLAVAQRIVGLAWLVAGAVTEDPSVRLLAGAFLASARGLSFLELAALLALFLLRLALRGEAVVLGICAYGPALLFLALVLGGDEAKSRTDAEKSAPAEREAQDRRDGLDRPSRLRRGETNDSSQLSQASSLRTKASIETRTSTQALWFQKAVSCFPDWAPPAKREVRLFQRSFMGIGASEQLLGVFACAVKRGGISHHGRLYLSDCHISFRSAMVMRRAVQFSLQFQDVEEVRLTESSLPGSATLVLKTPMSIRGFRDPASTLELRCQQGVTILEALVRRFAALTYVSDDEDEDDVDDCSSESDGEDRSSASSGGETPSESSRSSRRSRPRAQSDALFCAGEPFQKLLEANVPNLSLSTLAAELLGEEWPPDMFVLKFYAQLGGKDINVSDAVDEMNDSGFERGTDVAVIREIDLVMPVPPAPMCPSVTRVTVTVRVSVSGGPSGQRLPSIREGGEDVCPGPEPRITMETSAMSHDVPFGQNFLVQERTVLDASSDGPTVTKFSRIVFLKSCGFLQGQISRGATKGVVNGATEMVSLLQARRSPELAHATSGARSTRASSLATSATRKSTVSNTSNNSVDLVIRCRSVTDMTTIAVQIWELQRRTTLFHEDWRAPFLPHDGVRGWRWLDTGYHKHPWMAAGLRKLEVACKPEPPIEPGGGWMPIGDWRVAAGDSERMDADGWQYSNRYHRRDNRWHANSRACHCRRRLWTRTYMDWNEASNREQSGTFHTESEAGI